MVLNKNQCSHCKIEMELHFATGDYICIKCSPDDRNYVLSSDEIKRIDDEKRRKQEEQKQQILNQLIPSVPKHAYFITHVGNLVHILRDGILAPNQISNNYKKISNPDIVRKRDTQIYLPNKYPLNCYAHAYLRPDNAMLYNVLTEQKFKLDEIVIVEIKLDFSKTMCVLTRKNAVVCKNNDFLFPIMTDSNQNSNLTKTLEFFRETSNMLQMTRWNVDDENYRLSLKQRFMAEYLMKDRFSPEMFESVIVYDYSVKHKVKEILMNMNNNLRIKTNEETKNITNENHGFFFGGKIGK